MVLIIRLPQTDGCNNFRTFNSTSCLVYRTHLRKSSEQQVEKNRQVAPLC